MESVNVPPRRMYCSQAILISMRAQRIKPGRSSLNDLRSYEPIEGFNSRPMKNYHKGEWDIRVMFICAHD